MLAKPIAVPANVCDVAVMDEPVDQRGRHDILAEDLAPVFKPFVLVRVVDALSYRRVSSWKKSMPPVRVIGR